MKKHAHKTADDLAREMNTHRDSDRVLSGWYQMNEGEMGQEAFPFDLHGLRFENVVFADGDFEDVHFVNCHLKEVTFKRCAMVFSSFVDSSLSSVAVHAEPMDALGFVRCSVERLYVDSAEHAAWKHVG